MKTIDTHGITYVEPVPAGTSEWYYGISYEHGDLYEAEEVFLAGEPVRGNSLCLIQYPDGEVFWPVPKEAGTYTEKPRHDRYDSFRIRHPEMSLGKRAKLFAPFDALRGFDFAILMKNEVYADRVIMSPEDREELDRRLSVLHNLTYNSRMARANRPQVAVTYYAPCSDINSEAYGSQGQYKTITGICRNVDAEVTKTILIGETAFSGKYPENRKSRGSVQAEMG